MCYRCKYPVSIFTRL